MVVVDEGGGGCFASRSWFDVSVNEEEKSMASLI